MDLNRLFVRSHLALYRLTGGILGGSAGSSTHVLLLTTTGRKSGQPRTIPIRYLPHDSGYMIAASNWGKPQPPAWFLNLQANPTVTIQVMNKRMTARAEIASAAERDALYPQFIAADHRFANYPVTSGRAIPIVFLHPQ